MKETFNKPFIDALAADFHIRDRDKLRNILEVEAWIYSAASEAALPLASDRKTTLQKVAKNADNLLSLLPQIENADRLWYEDRNNPLLHQRPDEFMQLAHYVLSRLQSCVNEASSNIETQKGRPRSRAKPMLVMRLWSIYREATGDNSKYTYVGGYDGKPFQFIQRCLPKFGVHIADDTLGDIMKEYLKGTN